MGFFDKILGSGILGSIGGVIQSKIDSNTQKRNVDMTNQANKQMAEYQYNKELEMWNRANEYNSPAQQMARFAQAGLNPNLIYGQGNPGNSPNQLPQYQAPQQSFDYKPGINIGSVVQQYQDFKMRQAQIDNLKEQHRGMELLNDIRFYEKGLWEPYSGEYGGVKGQLAKYSVDLANKKIDQVDAQISGQLLKNLITQKDLNWYQAKELSNIVSKGLGSIGIFKLGKRMNGLRPYQSGANKGKEISRSVTRYYR